MEKSSKIVKIKSKIKAMWPKIKPYLTFKMAISFGIAWMITNGWSIVFIFLGSLLEIPWMVTVGGTWYALLWLPFMPEKIVTIAIAIFIRKMLFGGKNLKNNENCDIIYSEEIEILSDCE